MQMVAAAITMRHRVLILCPTGQLVASYRQRLPEHEHVRVDTIHAGMAIYREPESLVEHSPPSALRGYDLILIDECSQLDNFIAQKIVHALMELPQKPFIAYAADDQQLQPVGSGGRMQRYCETLCTTFDDLLSDFRSYTIGVFAFKSGLAAHMRAAV